MKAHILAVDDDKYITQSWKRALAYDGYSVDVAHTGDDALARALERPPDLYILDVKLPGMSGLEICRRLRESGDQTPVLMITSFDAVDDRVKGLDIGADDYLVKPVELEELKARVRALLRRRNPEQTETLRFADIELDTGTRMAHRGQRQIELSTTEYELLALFMRRPRQVLTRDLIMERVWRYDFGHDSNVLDVYIGYLRAKLESGGEPRLIQTVRRAGYALREKSESASDTANDGPATDDQDMQDAEA